MVLVTHKLRFCLRKVISFFMKIKRINPTYTVLYNAVFSLTFRLLRVKRNATIKNYGDQVTLTANF